MNPLPDFQTLVFIGASETRRRLADSNRCINPLALEAQSEDPRPTDFVTRPAADFVTAADIRTNCTTAFVTVAGAASQSDREVSPALPRSHRGGGNRDRVAARPRRTFRNKVASAEAGAAAAGLAAPAPRHDHVLPAPPQACAHEDRSARGPAVTRLGEDHPAGARGDTRAAASAEPVRGAGVVVARRDVCASARVRRLALGTVASSRAGVVERLLRRLSIRAQHLALDVRAGRGTRVQLRPSRGCVGRGAVLACVRELAAQRQPLRQWSVAELFEGVRLEVAA